MLSLTTQVRGFSPLILVGLTLFLAACAGEPTGDNTGDEDRIVDEAVRQALGNLESALANLDPCEPDVDQLKTVLDPLSVLQGTGADTAALETQAMEGVAPVVRSIGRAQAGGLIPGLDPALLTSLAEAAGLDPTDPTWMGDPGCTGRWRLTMEWTQSLPPPIAVSIGFTGQTEFLTSEGGGFVSAPGPITFDAAVAISPACSLTFNPGEGEFRAVGAHHIPEDEFQIETSWSDIPYTAVYSCPGLAAVTFPGALTGLTMPVTLPAEDGATSTVVFSAVEGQAVFTLRYLGSE